MKKIIGLSLFSNVGVAEALLSDIGIEIAVANEIDIKRAKFYSEIYQNTHMICGDITDANIKDNVIDISLKKGVNFIIATPPCQGMSEAGKRDTFDDRNELITHAIEIIHKLKPDFVLLENVPTLLKTKIRLHDKILTIPEYIISELNHLYNINSDTLVKSMEHGVPQMRQRCIFLLTKRELQLSWNFPKKQNIITLEKAIGHLPSVDPMLKEGIEFTLTKFPNFLMKKEKALKISKWHKPPTHAWKQVEWMQHTPSATSAIYNKKFYPQKDDGIPVKAHHNNYRRMDWNKPSRTITQNNGVISSLCCVHPGRINYNEFGEIFYSDPRVLTIYELLIVTTLPLDWPIPEWADDNFIRKVIGEGIPSLLVKNILIELLKQLKG